MDQTTTQVKIHEYFGIVVIIDALGVSDYPIDDCKKLIYNFEEINSQKEEFLKNFYEDPSKCEWDGARTISNIMKNVKTSQFGDTIELAFPIEDKYNIENLVTIYFVAFHLCSVILHGLTLKIPFRGAISIGKFVWGDSNKRLLGPAIADANDWCNTTEWFGIIFSPKAQFWLTTLIEEKKSTLDVALLMTSFNNFICKYKIPLKSSLKEPLNSQIISEYFFVVAWPSLFHFCHIVNKQNNDEEIFDGRWFFDQVLSDLPKPNGTELKYKNSVDFFNWFGTKIVKNKRV